MRRYCLFVRVFYIFVLTHKLSHPPLVMIALLEIDIVNMQNPMHLKQLVLCVVHMLIVMQFILKLQKDKYLDWCINFYNDPKDI